jgi:hypothetical protein
MKAHSSIARACPSVALTPATKAVAASATTPQAAILGAWHTEGTKAGDAQNGVNLFFRKDGKLHASYRKPNETDDYKLSGNELTITSKSWGDNKQIRTHEIIITDKRLILGPLFRPAPGAQPMGFIGTWSMSDEVKTVSPDGFVLSERAETTLTVRPNGKASMRSVSYHNGVESSFEHEAAYTIKNGVLTVAGYAIFEKYRLIDGVLALTSDIYVR